MQNLNVKAVSRILGLNENTLRTWERRYGAVRPVRNSAGRRLYSTKDLERIRLLAALVQGGYGIGNIAKEPTSRLMAMATGLPLPAPLAVPVTAPGAEDFSAILQPLKAFNLDRLQAALHKARFDLSPREIVLQLVLPLMKEVGRLVEEGEISVAQEHLLSALIRDHLGVIYQSLNPAPSEARVAALATREGDLHEFGILLSAILCRLHGWKTLYFGPNLPVKDFISAVEHSRADLLVLGLAKLPKEKEVIRSSSFLQALDRELPLRVGFCLGGGEEINLTRLRPGRKACLLKDPSELEAVLSGAL